MPRARDEVCWLVNQHKYFPLGRQGRDSFQKVRIHAADLAHNNFVFKGYPGDVVRELIE
jgi:hypothetical protein